MSATTHCDLCGEEVLEDDLLHSSEGLVCSSCQAQVEQHYEEHAENTSSGVPRWFYFIGILILANVLSAVFDWGFWIY